jgi:hypothetical protein
VLPLTRRGRIILARLRASLRRGTPGVDSRHLHDRRTCLCHLIRSGEAVQSGDRINDGRVKNEKHAYLSLMPMLQKIKGKGGSSLLSGLAR